MNADELNGHLHENMEGADVSVLLVFFVRSKCLQKVFNRIREVRPKELFLYQDGPRNNHPDDISKMEDCRDIVSHIDWDCRVHRLYQQKNSGADESVFLACSWAFSQTESCIVLEDDVVPSHSFFYFCAEMLKRFAHDDRVRLISSQNMEGETKDVATDYFFSPATFTWGWASWARVVRQWDPTLSFLSEHQTLEKTIRFLKESGIPASKLNRYRKEAEQGKKRWESILIGNQYYHQGFTIVPRCNMSRNIGLDADSAHYVQELHLMAKGDRVLFETPAHDLNISTLRHPSEVVPHALYLKRAYRLRAINHPCIRIYRTLESMFYMARAGKAKEALRGLVTRFKRVFRYGTIH